MTRPWKAASVSTCLYLKVLPDLCNFRQDSNSWLRLKGLYLRNHGAYLSLWGLFWKLLMSSFQRGLLQVSVTKTDRVMKPGRRRKFATKVLLDSKKWPPLRGSYLRNRLSYQGPTHQFGKLNVRPIQRASLQASVTNSDPYRASGSGTSDFVKVISIELASLIVLVKSIDRIWRSCLLLPTEKPSIPLFFLLPLKPFTPVFIALQKLASELLGA